MKGTWKRFSLAMLLLLPAASFAMADATLSGRVQNSGGTPQMGAVVEAYTSGSNPIIRAYTDAKGQYTLRGLNPGTYFIKASATQFLPSVREGVIVKAGSHVMLNLTLNTLIEAFQLLPSRKAEVKGEDDWRWTLRSAANRPILRVLDDNSPLLVVSKGENPADRSLKARSRGHRLARRIIRRLAGDRDVVDMAFGEACVGDANELRPLLQLRDGLRSGVTHRCLHPADQLVNDFPHRAFVRHLPLDAFRHELQMILDVLLEITVC